MFSIYSSPMLLICRVAILAVLLSCGTVAYAGGSSPEDLAQKLVNALVVDDRAAAKSLLADYEKIVSKAREDIPTSLQNSALEKIGSNEVRLEQYMKSYNKVQAASIVDWKAVSVVSVTDKQRRDHNNILGTKITILVDDGVARAKLRISAALLLDGGWYIYNEFELNKVEEPGSQ